MLVARLYLQRQSQQQIAEQTNVTQQQISLDVKELHKRWRASQLSDTHSAKLDALRRIDELEAVYWEHYRASQHDLEITSTKAVEIPTTRVVRGQTIASSVRRNEAHREVRKQIGSEGALRGIAWCIAERGKVLGIYPDGKLTLGGPDGQPVHFTLNLGKARPAVDDDAELDVELDE
jgi:hypothetical protein